MHFKEKLLIKRVSSLDSSDRTAQTGSQELVVAKLWLQSVKLFSEIIDNNSSREATWRTFCHLF